MPTNIDHKGLITRQTLTEFREFLMAHGWAIEEPKGEYEVLRMVHPEWPFPLLGYRNNRDDQVTTANVAYGWALMFRTFRRAHQDALRQKSVTHGRRMG